MWPAGWASRGVIGLVLALQWVRESKPAGTVSAHRAVQRAQWASGFREYMIYLSSDIENETRVTKAALQWQGGKGNKANDWLSQGMLKVGRCSAWTWSWCLWGWLNGLFLLCQHILSLLVRILCWIYPARFQINSAKQ